MAASAQRGEDNPLEIDQIREKVSSPAEQHRMQAVLHLREWKQLPPEGLALLEGLLADPSREVRTAARDVLKEHGRDVVSRQEARQEEIRVENRGNGLLALISFSSAGTGILATALTLISHYTMGRFPFPNGVMVLFWLNLALTVPYILLGLLLFLPGRGPRNLALGYAVLSLVGSLAAMFLLQGIFERSWSYQFSEARAQAYLSFLAPWRVGFMLLPLILGQSMLLYFLSNRRFQPAGPSPSTREGGSA